MMKRSDEINLAPFFAEFFGCDVSDVMPGHRGYQSMRHSAWALGETSRWIAVDAVPRRWDPMSSPPWSRRSRVGTVGRGLGGASNA